MITNTYRYSKLFELTSCVCSHSFASTSEDEIEDEEADVEVEVPVTKLDDDVITVEQTEDVTASESDEERESFDEGIRVNSRGPYSNIVSIDFVYF